ncbi:MAG TPA: hypothetical protein VIQ02_02005, partial [Jiangellaceae bacterium]
TATAPMIRNNPTTHVGRRARTLATVTELGLRLLLAEEEEADGVGVGLRADASRFHPVRTMRQAGSGPMLGLAEQRLGERRTPR